MIQVMQRDKSYNAITLKVHTSGEQRQAWFLTSEAGIIKATVFGGPKSRLRAYAAPFHQGRLLLYHNPVQDSYKVTDFDIQFWRQGIHEQYTRIVGAQSVSETILASYASGGNWRQAFNTVENALNALSSAQNPLCRRILVHFLWKWIDLLGLKPELDLCISCGAKIPASETLLFSPSDSGSLCTSCLNDTNVVPVSPGARLWIYRTQDLAPEQLTRYGADNKSLSQAKSLVTGIIASDLGRYLKTWELW